MLVNVDVVFFAYPGTRFLNIVIIFYQGTSSERANTPVNLLNKMGTTNIDPRRESLAMSSENVKMKIPSQCTFCQSDLESYFHSFVFNILKYCFVTLRIFSLFYDG